MGSDSADGGNPSFQVGDISNSAVNFGAHGTANNVNNFAAGSADPQQELLAAVRELRADLGRVTQRPETAALAEELAGTAQEIETTGAAERGRLARLRERLADAGPVVEFLASGSAVAAAVATLLGA
ncbi:hypothetical protein LG634_34935 [Streptomyces bambusae]|uniref:hypothetical protein n=1 Tax=Streptomyces bambusae TaxID=1550616 RepID=UPI001CFFFAD5|nr:hypothetical protein [Streptomyces bambusae]MCB5169985.1 hypothetical protein [Streptomyces bambusae]